jgi:osmoprotectant transport system substrate-binding protein
MAVTACGGGGDPLSTTGDSSGREASAMSLTVGSADFQENALLAEIYAGALETKGIAVSKKLNIGSRDTYVPALKDGSIDLIPEYSGALLQYVDRGATAVSSTDVYSALQKAVPAGLQVLEQSSAEDKDSMAVTKQTAEKYSLTSIADLTPIAKDLTLGAAPEFMTNPAGISGLKTKYGITFKNFKRLDAGGPLSVNGLKKGVVQVADLFSTDPSIAANGFVVLDDPRSLFTAQNVVPLINSEKVSPEVTAALDAVSAKLDTTSLAALLASVIVDKKDPASVAEEWLKGSGLA